MWKASAKGRALVGKPEQVLVRDHDQRINKTLHLGDSGLGLRHAALPFEIERLGDDANGQDAALARRSGDHRCRRQVPVPPPMPAGYEDHVAVGKLAHHRFNALLGGGASDIRLGSGTKSLRNRAAKLDFPAGQRMGKRLPIGVRDKEIDSIEVRVDHVVDGIAASAANTDDGDARTQFLHCLWNGQIDGHETLPAAVGDQVAACT
jgi:hypothetical protein